MRLPLWIIPRKQTAFGIVSLMLTITPPWLMLDVANNSACAQTSDDVSNSSAAAAASSQADWSQFLRDNMQRWNPYETVIGVNNAGSLGAKWKNPIGTSVSPNGIQSSPAVVNGVVYFGSDDHNVYALNADTGAKLWSFKTGGRMTSSPAVVNGVVYVGSDFLDGNLYALNANTGALLWSFATGGAVFSSPTVTNGVVYFGSNSLTCFGFASGTCTGILYGLNASTGAKLWSYSVAQVNGGISTDYSSPAVANGVVYFSAIDNNVYALNASTGTKLWSYATGGFPEYASPAVANGVVYVGSRENVYALDASTGARLWNFPVAKTAFTSLAVANGVVYVGASSGNGASPNVYALNANTGMTLWSVHINGIAFSAPAVANGVVYIFTYKDGLHALNGSTGALLWSFNPVTLPSSFTSPTIVNGIVYVRYVTESGANLYAFAPGLSSADLFLRIWPSATTVHQGDLITYAFPVWNLGPSNANFEVLNTQVPAGTIFEYIRISGTPGLGTCTRPPYHGTGQIVCHENSSMAPNTTWTVRLTVKVTAPAGTVITANAATMAQTPDPNMANNTATVSMKVQ